MKMLKLIFIISILCSILNPIYGQNRLIDKYKNYKGFEKGAIFVHKDLITIDGDTLKAFDLLKKIVWYNTWFIKCKACIVEMPELNNLVEKYKNYPNLEFIALTFEEPEKVKEFLQNIPFKFKIVSISAKELEEYYKVISYPKNLLIGTDGFVLKEKLGGTYDTKLVPALLTELFGLLEIAINGISQTANIFIPDTSINEQLFLYNSSSIEKHFGNITPILNKEADLLDVYISNNTEEQYLRMIFHPGSWVNQISEFEVGWINDLSSETKKISSPFESFITENEIILGMTRVGLIKRKGIDYKETIENDTILIQYIINDSDNSIFLERYNMPTYIAKYWIRNDKLIKFHFGFEYN